MGDWLGVNWRPFGPSCEVPGTDNGCVTVCPLCNAIWSVDHAQSGFPKKRRCNTGSFNSLLYPKRRLSLPKVRAYEGHPLYQPLLWQYQMITLCPQHYQRLKM